MNGKIWEVQHQCPQCGAPVILEETDRLFLCPFCKVKLYITAADYLRYCLASSSEIEKTELIYAPYWRFKGIAYHFDALQVRDMLVDATALAFRSVFMPATLGLRPQAMRLKFVAPGVEGSFVKRGIPIEDAFGFASSGMTFIGEMTSLIYSPVYVKDRKICDAFTGKSMTALTENGYDAFNITFEESLWQIKYLATLCPDCGWNLEGERDSCALFCRNCNSAWQTSGRGFERLDFASVCVDRENTFYLPFWQIRAKIDGMELSTYADLVKLANLPKAIKNEWYSKDLFFWTPAFKVRPDLFLRISRSVTISETQGNMEEHIPKGFLYPVTLPASEAGEAIKLIVADTAINKKTVFPLLKELRVAVEKCLLVFLPFSQLRDELQNTLMHLTVNKNAIKFGRNL